MTILSDVFAARPSQLKQNGTVGNVLTNGIILYQITCNNPDIGTPLYFQLYNIVTVPVTNQVALYSFLVKPTSCFTYIPSKPLSTVIFNLGLAWGVSTTESVLTISTTPFEVLTEYGS